MQINTYIERATITCLLSILYLIVSHIEQELFVLTYKYCERRSNIQEGPFKGTVTLVSQSTG